MIVGVAVRSPAVYVTVVPEVEDSRPPPLTDHVAGPGETVNVTSSPTPISIRARLDGWVATVCDVIVQEGQVFVAALAGCPGLEPERGLDGRLFPLLHMGLLLPQMHEHVLEVGEDLRLQASRSCHRIGDLWIRERAGDPRQQRIVSEVMAEGEHQHGA